MFILKILQYIRGAVFFCAFGGFPERFLNLCSIKNIKLNDVEIKDNKLFANTDIKSYKKLRHIARKSGMKIRLQRKSGLPFLLFKYRNRAGLILGTAVFFSLLFFLSSFLWTVDVSGNVNLSEREIIKAAQNIGIKSGVKRASIDPEVTAEKIIELFPDISFAAVNLQGSHAQIKIKEKPPIDIKDNDPAPCDIVASRDGQLVTIENFCGTQLLKENDAVLKGDVIISAVVKNMNESYTFKRAKGYITAKTNENITSEITCDECFYEISKINENNELFFFHIKVPIKAEKIGKDFYKQVNKLCLSRVNLPIGESKKRSFKLTQSKRKITPEQAKILAFEGFCNKLSEDFRYKKVLKSEIFEKVNRLSSKIEGSFILLENIGAKKPIILEKNQKK